MRHYLINVLYTYNNAFASDNEPLGIMKGHEVDITLNIQRPYPPVHRTPAYPACPRARESLEKHIQELIQLDVLRKLGNNEEFEVKTPVIIAFHDGKLRMVGDFRALNTKIPSMDELEGFHQNILIPKTKKLLRIIANCGIYEYLRIPFGMKCTISLSKNDEHHLPHRII
ncbi:hypothetical protein O181_048111 [Austropuccinia psidii MF-1]|uniref:Reverse transcriptase domain-containing protein n=1 Tax=Austropuccinia psidii MF-1 TaxID=1389203 RepID=A0A9Q3DQ28_9BASI|nr:hypothetical protein [Austropuccinia psidii MF-1]